MKVQTDQSNASYTEMPPSAANLIVQFVFRFFHVWTINLKSTSSMIWLKCTFVQVSLMCHHLAPPCAQDKSLYDASNELPFLDMVVEETLRLYPPAPK